MWGSPTQNNWRMWIPNLGNFHGKLLMSNWGDGCLLFQLPFLLSALTANETSLPSASKHWDSQYFPNTTSILSPWRQTKRHCFWDPGGLAILKDWVQENAKGCYNKDPAKLEQAQKSFFFFNLGVYFTCIFWQKIVRGPVSPGPWSSCSLRSITPSVSIKRDGEAAAFIIE